MLTHDDLDQLRGLIREEIAAEGTVTRREIAAANARTQADISRLTDRLTSLDMAMTGVHEAVEAVDRKLDQMQEDIAAILTTVIDHHTALAARVDRIEERLRS